MAGKIINKFKEPKYAEFSRKDLVIDIKNGILYYKSNLGVHRISSGLATDTFGSGDITNVTNFNVGIPDTFKNDGIRVGDSSITGTLTITEDSIIIGDTTIEGDITIGGDTTITGSIVINQSASFGNVIPNPGLNVNAVVSPTTASNNQIIGPSSFFEAGDLVNISTGSYNQTVRIEDINGSVSMSITTNWAGPPTGSFIYNVDPDLFVVKASDGKTELKLDNRGNLDIDGGLTADLPSATRTKIVFYDDATGIFTHQSASLIGEGILSSSGQIADDISGSFTSISASIATDIVAASQTFKSDGIRVGDAQITGSLIVTETITAQEFHTEFISSSIIFQSGSTIFGNTTDDTHKFTGTLSISGSGVGHITASGNISASGTITADTFVGTFKGALSSSAQIANDITGSWQGELSSSVYLQQVSDTISGSWKYNQNLLSSSAQIDDDISGSLGINADLIRSLTAAGISGSYQGEGVLSSSTQIADDISGSWQSQYFNTLSANIISGSWQSQYFSTLSATTITGSWKYNQNLLSSSAQIKNDISGSLGANADLIRSLTAAGISGSYQGEGVLSSSAQIKDDISGSLGANADLIRSLTAEGISGSSPFTATSISGSLGANADLIRSLTATTISGSSPFTATSITGSWKYNQNLLSSSAQIKDDISGSWQSQYFNTLTAAAISGSFQNHVPGLLSSSTQIKDDISGSLGTNADLIRSLTATGISGSSPFTATSITGSWKYNQNLLSSSAQIKNDISGSLGVNADLIRSLTAAGISGSYQGEGVLSSSAQIKDDISGSLGANADLIRSLTATTISGSSPFTATSITGSWKYNQNLLSSSAQIKDDISGSWQSQYFNTLSAAIISGSNPFTADSISGSLGTNADLIRSLTAEGISGSSPFTADSISGSLGANADLIRTLTATTISGSSPFTATSITGSWKYNQNLLSSSAQIKDDISGSLGANADLIRSLTATTISGSSPFTATSISGSLGANADLIRSLTATTISGSSPFTATSITGSWKYNQNLLSSSAQIKDDISGSWQGELSSSVYLQQVSDTISGSSPFTADSISGSWQSQNFNTLTAAAISGSFLLNTTDTLDGDLTVTGKITAQEFHTEFVSASIIYTSGSTQFGDTSDDIHTFSGSIHVIDAGNITASNNISASGIVSGISGSFPGIKTEHIQAFFPNSGIKIGRVEDDSEYFEIDDTFLMMVGDGTPILKVHKDASAVTIGNNVAVPQNQTFTVGGSISSSGTVTFSGLVNNPSNHILYYDRTIGALTFGDVSSSLNLTGMLSSSSQIEDDISGSWQGELSSSVYLQQVSDTISGSLGANADLIRTLTAAGISGSNPFTADSISGSLGANADLIRTLTADGISGSLGANADLIRTLTADGISGSLGANADLIRSLTAATISGSNPFTADSISGSLGANADLIRSLTAATISGSNPFTADSISGSLGANADLIRTLTATTISGSNPFTADSISGSLGANADLIRSLTATTISGSNPFTADSISGSLGANADLIRTLTAATISGSNPFTADSISGSLGANADLIRSLTATTISGSNPFTADSISGSLGANADLIRSLTAAGISGSWQLQNFANLSAAGISGSFLLNTTDRLTGDLNVTRHITASDGNISASGDLLGDKLVIDNFTSIETVANTGRLFEDGDLTAIEVGRSNTPNKNISLFGPITASGNISASGNITSSGLFADGPISSSGTITGLHGDFNLSLRVDGSDISLDSTGTLNIDNENTTNGITIGTQTDLVPISIGHTTSITTINDDLVVIGDITASNISASGTGSFGDINLPDDGKLHLGYSNDLQIYHDGSNSYIKDKGDGFLFIQGSNSLILESATGENYFKGDADGAVTLYHDNSIKLETAESGINITGNITASNNISSSNITAITASIQHLDGPEGGEISFFEGNPTLKGEDGAQITLSDEATISGGNNTLRVGTIVNVNTTHVTASGNISASGHITASSINLPKLNEVSTTKALFYDVDFGTVSYGTAATNYSAATISGSLGANADLIRTLTADGISGSLGANADLIRILTAGGISGSLGANADLIRTLTADGISGSWQSQDFANLSAAGISGSFLLNTTDILDGDLTVTGKITAQEFHTEFVSASIIFSSGSTQFGDTSDDIHTFSGSIHVIDAGNITASNNISASGLLFASASDAAGQPYLTVLVDTGSGRFYYTGSYGGGGGGEGIGFPYAGSDAITNDPAQAVITGSLFVSGSGHITASGNISASGGIITDNIQVMHDLIAANVFLPGQGKISFDDSLDGSDQFIQGTDHNITIDGDNQVNINADVAINLNQIVSASANIHVPHGSIFDGLAKIAKKTEQALSLSGSGGNLLGGLSFQKVTGTGTAESSLANSNFDGDSAFLLKLNLDKLEDKTENIGVDFPFQATNTYIAYKSGSHADHNTFKTSLATIFEKVADGVTIQFSEGNSTLKAIMDGGTISASSFSSPSQGTHRTTINGVNTDVDLGLQTTDSPTFNHITASGGVSASSGVTSSGLFATEKIVISNNKKILGKKTGGAERDLIHINNGNVVTVGNSFEKLRFKSKAGEAIIVDENIAMGSGRSVDVNFGSFVASGSSELLFRTLTNGTQPKEISINNFGGVGNITASGVISASGHITASSINLPLLNEVSTTNTLFYNSNDGTVSYGTAATNYSAATISGSLGVNADLIRSLTAAGISGSFLLNTTDTLTGNLTVTGDITASNISASSLLFASSSNAAGNPYLTVLVDTGSGRFYYTGSYGGGGGGGSADNLGDHTATQTLDMGGFTISGAKDIFIEERIYHKGDPDTNIKFNTDEIIFSAGGTSFFKLKETTQNEVVINDGSGDVDFRIESDSDTKLFFTDGGNSRVAIGTNDPKNKFQVMIGGGTNNNGIQIVRNDSTTTGNEILGGIGFDSNDGDIPDSILKSSAYVAAYASQTHGNSAKGGYLTFGTTPDNQAQNTLSSERIRIQSDGKVGINTTTPSSVLDVSGTIKGTHVKATTSVSASGIGLGRVDDVEGGLGITVDNTTKPYSPKITFDPGGTQNGIITSGDPNLSGNDPFTVRTGVTIDNSHNLNVAGDIIAFYASDKRLKDNVTPISNPIKKILQIGGYSFDWNEKQDTYKGHDIGVIAQEVEKVLPEVVETRENGYKAVKYQKMVPLLIEAIKDQQKQIDELKEMIKKLTK